MLDRIYFLISKIEYEFNLTKILLVREPKVDCRLGTKSSFIPRRKILSIFFTFVTIDYLFQTWRRVSVIETIFKSPVNDNILPAPSCEGRSWIGTRSQVWTNTAMAHLLSNIIIYISLCLTELVKSGIRRTIDVWLLFDNRWLWEQLIHRTIGCSRGRRRDYSRNKRESARIK